MYHSSFTPSGCSSAGIPSVELAAGVQFAQAYKFADDNGKEIVGGDCSRVGAAGGWLQGGGHGALTPRFGLGVDNTLQWEIVTADGVLKIANACQNKDLFWALRGGGGGTWGVATRTWVKAYPQEELVGLSYVRSISIIILIHISWNLQGFHPVLRILQPPRPSRLLDSSLALIQLSRKSASEV